MIAGHVFLVGMEGSGKSTLGSRLAAEMSLPFVDTDQQIAKMFGVPSADTVKSLGEELYHNAETGVLMTLTGAPPAIVVTGADLPLYKENVQLMQNHGVIVHIERPLDQLLAEQKVSGEADCAAFLQQFNQRIGYYRACADYTLQNDHGLQYGMQALHALVISIQ